MLTMTAVECRCASLHRANALYGSDPLLYESRIMPTTDSIDIHPHIIAADVTRYPLAPLGGHQSDWSRTRPVTVEQLIAAMDESGVQKAAIVQASTCYGHDNSYVADAVAAYPQRFTGVFSVDVLAADAPERMRHWRGKGLTGLRLFTFGSTMSEQANWLDDPKSYPAWSLRRRTRPVDLPADVGQGDPAGDRHGRALSERAHHPRSRRATGAGRRPALQRGRQPVRAGALSQHLYQAHAAHFRRMPAAGKATPETFFPRLVAAFGASRLAWGSNYPSSEGTLPELLAVARAIACLLAGSRSGMDLRQDRAGALSGAGGLRRHQWPSKKSKLFTLLGNYPNTMALKDGAVKSDLVDVRFRRREGVEHRIQAAGARGQVRCRRDWRSSLFCRPRPTASPMR